MKPIKLIISAIGPYAGEVPEIRFDQFEERGLFLISGDTGAGKTTIFDSICYALYGETSGSYRDSKNLRSEYAEPETNSFVDFYFSHQGKDYHVRRTPEYERKKSRGEGTTLQKATAVFYEEGKAPIEGLKPVETAVKELLHIDRNQFKQIAMIAQGEFREMLNARTDQRTEILRTIFMTGNYKAIEDKLKARMDASDRERLQTESSIVQHFGDVTAMPESELAAELGDLQDKSAQSRSAWNSQDFIDIIDRIVAADEESRATIQERLTALIDDLDKCKERLATAEYNNGLIHKVEALQTEQGRLSEMSPQIDELRAAAGRQKTASHTIAPTYNNWTAKARDNKAAAGRITESEKTLTELEAAAKAAAELLEAAESRRSDADELKLRADRIAGDKDKYIQRDKLRTSLEGLEKQKKDLEEEKTAIDDKEIALKDRIDKCKETIADLKSRPDELSAVLVLEKDLESLKTDLEKITTDRAAIWKQQKKALQEKQQTYIEASDNYDSSRSERERAEKLYEDSRAGLLASKLVEGEKCPVCGSVHHPEPARLPDESITEDELNKLKADEEARRNTKDTALLNAETARTELEETERTIREEFSQCAESPHANNASAPDAIGELLEQARYLLDHIKDRLTEVQADKKRLESDCKLLDESRESLEKAQGEDTDALNTEKKNNADKLQALAVDIASAKTALEGIRELGFESWEAAEKEKEECEKQSESLLRAIKEADEKRKSADTSVAEKKAEIKTLKDNLTHTTEEEARLESTLQNLMSEHEFRDIDELKMFIVPEEIIADNEKTVSEYDNSVSLNKAQLEQASRDAEGLELIDTEVLKAEVKQKSDTVETVRSDSNDIGTRIKINTDKRNTIQELRPVLDKARKSSTTLRTLYELVKGQTRNGKITLEQYVQATGFDGIIRAANRRLLPMSDGQFELYRQEDSLGKKSNTFLDLEVLDNYTGHRRPVGNLSGGESFKASLSLALGLSDTVSSNLGGVQMDALFIDEGFGSLDRKSIESAMDILLNLSNTHKLVGIISHREELKESIPQQIKVTKTRSGSTIEMDRGV
ncbi:MAG: SMC family ATPase [Mogibacterium sp.]|nr:SMC family ATPase [Mogibacterium sp.]